MSGTAVTDMGKGSNAPSIRSSLLESVDVSTGGMPLLKTTGGRSNGHNDLPVTQPTVSKQWTELTRESHPLASSILDVPRDSSELMDSAAITLAVPCHYYYYYYHYIRLMAFFPGQPG